MTAEPFSSRTTADRRVLVWWEGRLVVTVAGAAGRKLADALDGAGQQERQLLLARATRNFKRGNER